MKYLIILLLTCVCIHKNHGQNNEITIEREYNERSNNYKIIGENNTNLSHVIDLSLYNTNNMSCHKGKEFSVTLRPGKHTIARINSLDKTRRPSFAFRYYSRPGNIRPKPDKKIIYLLPVAVEKETKISELSYLGESYGNEKEPKGWYSISFSTEKGDTIFATRAGIVSKVIDNAEIGATQGEYAFTRNVNKVEVEHDDGTYGVYSVFKNGSIMLEVGDRVVPSQAIGITSGSAYRSGSHLRFSIYFYDKKANKKRKLNEPVIYEYLTPKFFTSKGKSELEIGSIYRGIYDQKIILDEMSRREKKKWRKSNTE